MCMNWVPFRVEECFLNDLILNVMLLNELSYRQDKRMDELNLFIQHYLKYIVSII